MLTTVKHLAQRIAFILLITLTCCDQPRVCLPKLGCLKGTHMPGFQTAQYEAFRGIPFAEPPLGALRFKNPQPIAPWQAELDATQYKSKCLQKHYNAPERAVEGSEDCLYLNVYRPFAAKHKPLPVLFYIHPGGFFSGCPNFFQAAYFMDTEEVILVEAGFRLGPFGFLSTGTADISGNFGLKDQNLALKWVQEHIAAFDGDPGLVTLFGHSGGVQYHMIIEASSGLFQRAMSFSGLAIAPYALPVAEPLAQARIVAAAGGVDNAATLSTSELAKALSDMDALSLLNAGDVLKSWHMFPITNFRPVLEHSTVELPFLTKCPVKAQFSGDYAQVPWLLSTVPKIGAGAIAVASIIDNDELRAQLNANFDELLAVMLEARPEHKSLIDALITEYMAGRHELNNDTYKGLAELMGDYYFYYPLYNIMKTHVGTTMNPLYMYMFEYQGPYSFQSTPERDFGVGHLDDTIYMFSMPARLPDPFEKHSKHASFVEHFVNVLIGFAKFGKLAPDLALEPCMAAKFNANNESIICDFLHFQTNGDIIDNYFEVKMKSVWQQIIGY